MNRTTVNRRYKIERKIGEGGMAEVYLGHDDLLHRPVAIKSLRPQYAADAGFRTRFEREAQAAASFSHPNIIDIYDVGEDRGTPYLVMEYVPGETLKEIIANEGPFDPDDVAILIEQVASALDYAHERGFVHRDIKPQNILVDGDGLAKVVDFGIAKGLADSPLTEAGSGLGTVHYVSPEQASGLMATPSSDIYSLAVVAYEMLTNRLPFDSDSAVGIAMKHINEQPRHPSLVNPDVPRQAGDIVLRGLAKDPTKRFPTAGAFARALNDWRTYGPPATRQPAAAEQTVWIPPEQRTAVTTDSQPAAPQRATRSEHRGRPVGAVDHVPAGLASSAPDEPVPLTDDQRTNLGCVSWVVGAGVILGLAALVWFGSRLSDRLSGFGAGDETKPTPTQAVIADEVLPTATTAVLPSPTGTAVIAASAPTQMAKPDGVAVPSLVGLAVDDARDSLDRIDLVLEVGNDETSEEVPAGNVSSQDPAPGVEVDPGTSVRVNLSTGPAAIDLASFDPADADPDDLEERLRSSGLDVARRQESSADVAEGRVIRLEPGDSAKPGDTVTIVVSAGNKVQIPADLQGTPVEEAKAKLEALGLTVANEVPVSQQVIVDAGIADLAQAGIEDQDVVGIQDSGATFGGFVASGAEVILVYYDAQLDGQ
ncbi:MAG TPA: Stk1 family PASTA domain-containing Ser/Thr kinase [Thermomicrobiales bacterium]